MWTNHVRRSRMLCAIWLSFAAVTVNAAPLTLIDSSPSNNAIDVSRVDVLNLQFSAPLSAYSVRSDTVTLGSNAGTQKVGLSLAGSNIAVKPLTPLLPWTSYTLNAKSLVSTAGEPLTQLITVVFKTRDATWQPPATIDSLSPEQFNPTTAVNNKGVRFVAWQQSNGVGDDIWAVRHVPGETSPGAPTLIASLGQDWAEELKVFVDEQGNAFVAWQVAKASLWLPRRLWASRFVTGSGSGSGWGAAQAIDGYAARSGTNLHLVFDRAGDALVIWQEWDCCGIHSLQSIAVNRYTQRSGWSKPSYLEGRVGFLAGDTALQIDASGNAYAAWATTADIHYPTPHLNVSRYAVNSGWSEPHTVAIESTYNGSSNAALAVNPRGEAFLMWADDSGLKYAHADELGRWGTPIGIDPNVHIAPSSMVFLDSGIAFAAFIDGVKMFRPDLGWWDWTHPLLPQQNATTDPRIVADKSGNALVAWTQNNSGINRIYAKRYRAGRGWLNSSAIDIGNTLGAGLEELFLDANGSASAAWSQLNNLGTSDVKVATFK